eukprot:m.12469 g.12469  ORF g.12469 m.12469 type:complete len:81 (-) comp4550_c0_seq1:7013-7255(-)
MADGITQSVTDERLRNIHAGAVEGQQLFYHQFVEEDRQTRQAVQGSLSAIESGSVRTQQRSSADVTIVNLAMNQHGLLCL